MSEQAGGLLETRQSYNFEREKVGNYKGGHIDSSKFYSWQKDNMYKSSYNHFHSYDSNHPNNSAVPGYQGFVPTQRANSLYGKSNTLIAKQSLSKDRLDVNRTGLASTGFNITKQSFLDKSKHASSSKYGKTALMKAHPNWNENWQTTNQINYQDPKDVPDPMYRHTDRGVEGKKLKNKESGFGQNSSYWDGTGWKPERVLNAQNIASQYRNRFNPEKQFHRETDVQKQRKMKAVEKNYQYNF